LVVIDDQFLSGDCGENRRQIVRWRDISGAGTGYIGAYRGKPLLNFSGAS
jgi:hypothetical protein